MTHAAPHPGQKVFAMPFVVPNEDIDMLGHASNIAYVRWVQDVARRVRELRERGGRWRTPPRWGSAWTATPSSARCS